MRKIKVGFVDFWDDFNPKNDPIFGKFFLDNFNIEYDNNNPDFLFFSVGGNRNKQYNCKKILFTPENFFCHKYLPLDYELGKQNLFKYADFSITSFDLDDEKNLRLPCYIRRYGFQQKNIIENRNIPKKTKEILYIQRNCQHFRDNFALKMQKYFRVDCVGNCMRNLNIHVEDKLKFMEDYKFIIAFENSSTKNYNTEKIVDGFLAKTFPLYWGDPNIKEDFNQKSFLYYNDYENEEKFIEEIIRLNSNEEEYYDRLKINPIKNQELFLEKKFINFINKIFYS